MPQLDIFSWFNQVLSTLIVMFLFYMSLILLFLPTTTAIFKGRTKLNHLRNLVIAFFTHQVAHYLMDTKTNLNNIFVNSFVTIWMFFSNTKSVTLNNEVTNNCYKAAPQELDVLYLNLSLVKKFESILAEKLAVEAADMSEENEGEDTTNPVAVVEAYALKNI